MCPHAVVIVKKLWIHVFSLRRVPTNSVLPDLQNYLDNSLIIKIKYLLCHCNPFVNKKVKNCFNGPQYLPFLLKQSGNPDF